MQNKVIQNIFGNLSLNLKKPPSTEEHINVALGKIKSKNLIFEIFSYAFYNEEAIYSISSYSHSFRSLILRNKSVFERLAKK